MHKKIGKLNLISKKIQTRTLLFINGSTFLTDRIRNLILRMGLNTYSICYLCVDLEHNFMSKKVPPYWLEPLCIDYMNEGGIIHYPQPAMIVSHIIK